MPDRDSYQNGEYCWVDLNAHDMEAAGEFYSQLFGWTVEMFDTQGGPPYAGFLNNDKQVGGLGQMSDEMKAQGVPPMWNCYLKTEDVDATVAKVEAAGGNVMMPAMTVLDAGRMAFITEPTGAVVGLWQPINHFGAQQWKEFNAPCWGEISTREIEKTRAFFEEVIGWTCTEFPDVPSKYYVCNVGEEMTGGILQMTEEWGDAPPSCSVYFNVEDVAAKAEKVTELGGKMVVPPFDASVGTIAGAMDAQGAFFYMIRMLEQG